ncbi:integrase core subunit [Streptococcus pneumoniae]|nr:integrase core subunit [Streptococcus pneumoniae]
MLEQAFKEKHYENTILHSDQGWQYQHDSYHRFLESKGIQASMSRKGNSQDNGRMESFFGILKSEMFYGYEQTFKSLNQLEQAIIDYIDYYNNKRIKIKLKGPEERTELERLQAENEYLRAENAILKKLRELRLKEEKEKEERQKLFKN